MGKNEKGSLEDTGTSKTSKADNKTENVSSDSKDTKFSHVEEDTALKIKENEKGTSNSNIDENMEEGLPDSFRVTRESLYRSNFPTQDSLAIYNNKSEPQDQTRFYQWKNLILSEHSQEHIDNYAPQGVLDQSKERDAVEVVTTMKHKSNEQNVDNQGITQQKWTLNNLGKDKMKLEEDDNVMKTDRQSTGEQATEVHKWEQNILIPVHNTMSDVQIHSSSSEAFVWSTDINLIKMDDNREARNEVCENCGQSVHQSETKTFIGDTKDKNEISEININAMNAKDENVDYADELVAADNATHEDWKSHELSQETLLSDQKHSLEDTDKVKEETSNQRENISTLESFNVRNKEFVGNKPSPETLQQSTNKSFLENFQSVTNKSSNVKYSISDESKSDVTDVTLDKVIKNVIKSRTVGETDTKKSLKSTDSTNENKTNGAKTELKRVLDENIKAIDTKESLKPTDSINEIKTNAAKTERKSVLDENLKATDTKESLKPADSISEYKINAATTKRKRVLDENLKAIDTKESLKPTDSRNEIKTNAAKTERKSVLDEILKATDTKESLKPADSINEYKINAATTEQKSVFDENLKVTDTKESLKPTENINEDKTNAAKTERKSVFDESLKVTDTKESLKPTENINENKTNAAKTERKSVFDESLKGTDAKESLKPTDKTNENKTRDKTERKSVLDENIKAIEKYLREKVSDITFEETAKNDTKKFKEGKDKQYGKDFEINSSEIPLGKDLKNRPKNDTKDAVKIGPAMKKKNENMAKNTGRDIISKYTELIKLRQDMKEKNDLKSSSLEDERTTVLSQDKSMKSISHKASDSNETGKTHMQSPKISNKITENTTIWKIADNVNNIKDELFDVKHTGSVKEENAEKNLRHSSQATTQKSALGSAATNLSTENFEHHDIGNFRKKGFEIPKNTETDEKRKFASEHLEDGLNNKNEQVHIQPRFPIATMNKIYLGKQAYAFPPKSEEIPLPWSSRRVPKDNDIYNDISEKSAENDHRTGGNFGQFFARQSAVFKENFNNSTIRGRANVAKATLLAVGLFTVWQIFKPKKHDLMLHKCPDCGSKNAM